MWVAVPLDHSRTQARPQVNPVGGTKLGQAYAKGVVVTLTLVILTSWISSDPPALFGTIALKLTPR